MKWILRDDNIPQSDRWAVAFKFYISINSTKPGQLLLEASDKILCNTQ